MIGGRRKSRQSILFGARGEKPKILFGAKWQLRKILFGSQRVKLWPYLSFVWSFSLHCCSCTKVLSLPIWWVTMNWFSFWYKLSDRVVVHFSCPALWAATIQIWWTSWSTSRVSPSTGTQTSDWSVIYHGLSSRYGITRLRSTLWLCDDASHFVNCSVVFSYFVINVGMICYFERMPWSDWWAMDHLLTCPEW